MRANVFQNVPGKTAGQCAIGTFGTLAQGLLPEQIEKKEINIYTGIRAREGAMPGEEVEMIAEIALAAILHQCCVTTDEHVRYQQLAQIEQACTEHVEEWYEPYYYEPLYYEPSDGLNAFTGVNYYDGRRETYYSSNVLYHYRTNEWWVDEEGFYRTDDGYYVVAASDMEQGTVFEGSKGECIVLDTGCAEGTTDYYVRW